MIPTNTRLTALERDFQRIDVADQPKISKIMEEGREQMLAGTFVEPLLDIAQLELDAKKSGLEARMAQAQLRVIRWRSAAPAPTPPATALYAPTPVSALSTSPPTAASSPGSTTTSRDELIARIDQLLLAHSRG